MRDAASSEIVVAGAGIAGLAAALAFASHGFPVRIFERAPKLEELGAGLQLSPNATRLLEGLGVLDLLQPVAVQPRAVVLRDGSTLKELARVPLGAAAKARWGAPYLVLHRADLQNALLARVGADRNISLSFGATVSAPVGDYGAKATVEIEGRKEDLACRLLVGADGVHSAVREMVQNSGAGTFVADTGRAVSANELAWRTTIAADGPAAKSLAGAARPDEVSAFLRPDFHLIAYPIRAGAAFNLVAFTRAQSSGTPADGEAVSPRSGTGAAVPVSAAPFDPADAAPQISSAPLRQALARCAAPLRQLLEGSPAWTAWPVHTVDPRTAWTASGKVVLIGDAAHAMTPYAAQGAAMAIEDAVTLAAAVANGRGGNTAAALAAWETMRRPRIARVARRAAFNRFVWHARGPVALARNLALSLRSGERLAADMDWLYGYQASSE